MTHTARRLAPSLLALLLAAGCSDLPADFNFDGGGPLEGGAAGDGGTCACAVPFSYENATASSVALRGSFDGWGPGVAMSSAGKGIWTASPTLRHGARVEYKFYVDGKTWVSDPENPQVTGPNQNSYLDVVCASCPALPDAGVPDVGVPPDQFVASDGDAGATAPFDWRDGVMYFVMVDRFLDGDSSNNKAVGIEKPADWQGGDLAGVLQKLKAGYFTGLGVSVLWLSSPVDAPTGAFWGKKNQHKYTGYHGYWPTELSQVEARLGTMALLKQVVDEAHKRGIKVILDYVMNHVHEQSSTYKSNPSWFWPLNVSGSSCLCGKGCSWAPPQGLRCWFDPFLPDFNFQNASARSFSVQNAIWWIQQTGIDGCRLDAVKHIEMSWLTDFRAALKTKGLQKNRRFYLVGETFDGDRSVIKKFVNPATMLDGQFDFPLRAQLAKVILSRKGSFKDLDTFLQTNDTYYGAGSIMGTFISNHDLPRAVHLAEDTPLFGEWENGETKAWNTGLTVPGYARPFERLAVAYTFLFTTAGVPLIYYGGEIGMAGGGDPDNRRMMQWSNTSAHQDKLKATIAKLAQIRSKNSALRYGTRKQVWLSDDIYAYEMSYYTDKLVVVLNRSDKDLTVTNLKGSSYTDLLSGQTINPKSFTMPARSAMILK